MEAALIAVAAFLGVLLLVLIAAIVLLTRRLWQVMASIECLCNNTSGLREQIGQGGHGHG